MLARLRSGLPLNSISETEKSDPRANLKAKNISLVITVTACVLLAACGSSGTKPTEAAPVLSMSVATTNHPLVAQATITSACSGQVMVEFGPDTTYGRNTAWYGIDTSNDVMIQVAGMRASTTYHMRVQRQCSGSTDAGSDTTFSTGALPSSPLFPVLQVSRPSPSTSTPENPGVEMVDIIAAASGQMEAFVTDRDANPIWYYDVGAGGAPYVYKLLPNGHVIFEITSSTLSDTLLREVDLAGNTIREMDMGQLVQKTQAAGYDFIPANFHHDVLPLDNGHLVVLVSSTKAFTDLPGYPGTTQVIGDQIIDLDENWNPVWKWNSFDYLDVTRHLNGLPDWTHSNALLYTADGNLLLSIRHQSWVIKIDYNKGTGSGNILWRFGYEGDFPLAQGDDPSNWFSFQHFPSIISQNGPQTTLAVWDNGDSRYLDTTDTTTCGTAGEPGCYSRAPVYQLDESLMTANLVWVDVPGFYSQWGGSINQLSNGNIEFDGNALNVPPVPNVVSEVQEVTQTSTPQVVWKMDIPSPMFAYRAYRIPSLYPGVTWQY